MGTDLGQEDERPPHRVFVDRFELAVFRLPAPSTRLSRTPRDTGRPETGPIRPLPNQTCLSWASAGSMQ